MWSYHKSTTKTRQSESTAEGIRDYAIVVAYLLLLQELNHGLQHTIDCSEEDETQKTTHRVNVQVASDSLCVHHTNDNMMTIKENSSELFRNFTWGNSLVVIWLTVYHYLTKDNSMMPAHFITLRKVSWDRVDRRRGKTEFLIALLPANSYCLSGFCSLANAKPHRQSLVSRRSFYLIYEIGFFVCSIIVPSTDFSSPSSFSLCRIHFFFVSSLFLRLLHDRIC